MYPKKYFVINLRMVIKLNWLFTFLRQFDPHLSQKEICHLVTIHYLLINSRFQHFCTYRIPLTKFLFGRDSVMNANKGQALSPMFLNNNKQRIRYASYKHQKLFSLKTFNILETKFLKVLYKRVKLKFLSHLFPVPPKLPAVSGDVHIYYIFLLLCYYGSQNFCFHWTGRKMRHSRSNVKVFDDDDDDDKLFYYFSCPTSFIGTA